MKLHQRAWAAATGPGVDHVDVRSARASQRLVQHRRARRRRSTSTSSTSTARSTTPSTAATRATACSSRGPSATAGRPNRRQRPRPGRPRADPRGHRRAPPHRPQRRRSTGAIACAASSAARSRRRRDGGRLHPRRRLPRRPGWRCIVTARLCELREIRLPLVAPFQTSFGTQTSRRILLVRAEVERDGVTTEGWGECVAGDEPTYSSEYVDGAALVIREVLAPRLAAVADLRAADVAHVLAPVRGHPMAKAALEMAVLDAELRAEGRSFADLLGVTRDRIPSGVSVGIHPTDRRTARDGERLPRRRLRPRQAEDRAGHGPRAGRRGPRPDRTRRAAAGRRQRRLHPPRRRAPRAARRLRPAADRAAAAARTTCLGHAELARAIGTPVCLDESITSETVCADAIDVGAAEIVNIKAGRVGGYLTARRIHDLCRERGHPGVVRRDARDRHRARRQRRARRDGRLHAARRRVGVSPVLGPGHRHRADRGDRRPCRRPGRPRVRFRRSTASSSTS